MAPVVWFTGLSGAGKSTLSELLKSRLEQGGHSVLILDGDRVRYGLCKDLDFSEESRRENIRRVAEVARLAVENGIICLVALISPFRSAREAAREIIGADHFLEVYLKTSLTECEKRDVKGLYAQARDGQVPTMTGLTSPYEPPVTPTLTLDTANESKEDCLNRLIALLAQQGVSIPGA